MAGQEKTTTIIQDARDTNYELESRQLSTPTLSSSGKWVVIRQQSHVTAWEKTERDGCKIMVFDIRVEKKPVLASFRENIWDYQFCSENYLLLWNNLKTELLDLERQKSLYFNDVKKAMALKNKNQFLLHYNQEKNNRLELRTNKGFVISQVDRVTRFYISETNLIFAITQNEAKGYAVVLVNENESIRIYSTLNKIVSLWADREKKGLFISEKPEGSDLQEIVYLDIKNKTVFPLKEVVPATCKKAYPHATNEGDQFFMRLWVPNEKENTELADIWYGNDFQLEKKFQPKVHDVCYLWEPTKKKIEKLMPKENEKIVNIGNDRYFLSFDPYKHQDYVNPAPLEINIYDRVSNQLVRMDTIEGRLYTSPTGHYIIYYNNNLWFVYNTETQSKRVIDNCNLKTPYFSLSGDNVIFDGKSGLWRYDLKEKKLDQLSHFNGYDVTLFNGKSRIIVNEFEFFEKTIDLNEPIILGLYNKEGNNSSYLLWDNGDLKTIVTPTTKHVKHLVFNKWYSHFCYTEEDYNLPPQLVYKEIGKKEILLIESNQEDKSIRTLKQEIVSYTTSNGQKLNGILYYPLNVLPEKKHPMIVHIYQGQRHLSNRYPYLSYYETLGFNIRLLIENGYFVYLPDIELQGKEGPGLEALDCINKAMDALGDNPQIDHKKIGLTGHSLGGYETNFIATHSERFAAYVSGSGHSDIIKAYYSFNYDFRFPDFIRIETLHYKMGIPFTENKILYMENNPLYYAENVKAPVLLWTGLEDQNVTSDHTMAFYLALRRNKKEVIALFYKGEGHSLQKEEAQYDLTTKTLEWFNYFLKGEQNIVWINNGMNKRGAQ